MKKNNLFTLAITTGDQDGIGAEVCFAALKKLGPINGVRFLVLRGNKVPAKILNSLGPSFRRTLVSSLSDALDLVGNKSQLIEVLRDDLPPKWVEDVAWAARAGAIDGIVNAPLSKTLIQKAGLKELGHTEILSRITKSKPLTMSFWGPHFSVALGSTHIPLKDVPSRITTKNIEHHLRNVALFFPRKNKKFRIGVVGVNPHAGEAGLIGKEESRLFIPALRRLRREFPRIEFSDPLVPDTAFLPRNHKNYDVFFCTYHDQGLIPFKMFHEQSRGCQISLGLPFVRTSVDHGTAKDLYGKNKADSGSMLDAIKTAISLVKSR